MPHALLIYSMLRNYTQLAVNRSEIAAWMHTSCIRGGGGGGGNGSTWIASAILYPLPSGRKVLSSGVTVKSWTSTSIVRHKD